MARPRNRDLLNALFLDLRKQAAKKQKGDRWQDKAALLRGMLMPKQALADQDNARRLAIISARQVGKSTFGLFKVTIECLAKPNAEWVVIGLTRPSVQRIYWQGLQRLSAAMELGIKFQHQQLVAIFPNGSRIYFVGGEKVDDIEKLRGGRYHGAIIDECASYGALVFQTLIEDILEPALMGQAGQLILIGTPGTELAGQFYLATCQPGVVLNSDDSRRLSNAPYGSRPEFPAIWSLHIWTLQDNVTRFRDPKTGTEFTMWEQALKVKADRGWDDSHPTWRREYLGQWVPSQSRRVYRYFPHLHDYTPCEDTRWGLPGDLERAEWRTVVGVDLGTRDGTAIVVWAYSPTEQGLWELYSEKRTADPGQKLPVSYIAKWFKEVEDLYGPFDSCVADYAGLGTMVMDTLAEDHSVYLEPAEKKQKLDHIQLFNNDLDAGLIHVRRNSELAKELLENKWLEKTIGKEKREEDPGTPNDLCDGGLYAFRWCRHRKATPLVPAVQMFTPAWYAEMASRDLKAAEDRARNNAGGQLKLDRDWWSEEFHDTN